METFLFGVYISATVYLCWHAAKLDEDNYPNKKTSNSNITNKDNEK